MNFFRKLSDFSSIEHYGIILHFSALPSSHPLCAVKATGDAAKQKFKIRGSSETS